MALDYSIIGERLKRARLAKNMTQENLAEQLDVSVAFLSRVERGHSHLNLNRLTQVCELLDVSEGYILSGSSENSESYLEEDFKKLLAKCSPEKQKLIYKLSQVIAEEDETYKSKK
jgi:transcriptional regulator with XRE-family HTH domain